MGYQCLSCKKDVESAQVTKRVICPFCGYRILRKTRPETVKHVKAR